jgi:hypothetical protein
LLITSTLLVVWLVQERVVHLGAGADGLDQLHLLRAQGAEYRAHIGGLHPRLIVLQQRVVYMVVRSEELREAAAVVDDLFQVRSEFGEVVLGARLLPHRECLGSQFGQFGDHLRRHLGQPVVLSAGDFDQPRLVRVWWELGGSRCQLIQQPAYLIRGHFNVRQLLDRGHLLAARLRARGWHVSLLVPCQQIHNIVQVGYFSQYGFELVQLLLHGLLRSPV